MNGAMGNVMEPPISAFEGLGALLGVLFAQLYVQFAMFLRMTQHSFASQARLVAHDSTGLPIDVESQCLARKSRRRLKEVFQYLGFAVRLMWTKRLVIGKGGLRTEVRLAGFPLGSAFLLVLLLPFPFLSAMSFSLFICLTCYTSKRKH